MSKLIPASIQPDMNILLEITQGKRDYVVNEQGLTSEVAVYGDSECGGLMLAFNSPNSLSHSTGDFDYELFLRSRQIQLEPRQTVYSITPIFLPQKLRGEVLNQPNLGVSMILTQRKAYLHLCIKHMLIFDPSLIYP